MRVPAIHTADAIRDCDVLVEIDGNWWLARPEPYYNWKIRWKLAWMVFTGKADALKWIEQ